MADQENNGVSKSAKRRAAKKAREAAEGAGEVEEAPAPAPAPEPKAKAKAKAKAVAKEAAAPPPAAKAKAEPKAEAKAPAKAAGKAQAKVQPKAEPKAEAKAQPKAKAKAQVQAPAEPKAPEPKAEAAAKPKADAKPKQAAAKPKAKAKAVEEEAPKKREASPERFVQLDDGTGGEWEVSSGLTKKAEKRKARVEEQQFEAKVLAAHGLKPGQAQQSIPGMAPASEYLKSSAPKAAGASQQVDAGRTAAIVAAALAEKEKAVKEAAEKAKVEPPASTASIKVPDGKIGIVIGPKGAKIKMLQEKTGAKIDTSGEIFTVTGSPQAVSQAEAAIKELIEKGYSQIEFENFAEQYVAVHPSAFPDIIGKQGIVIRTIKDQLGVQVNIPDAPKNAAAGKKYKVMLAGKNENVDKAKDVINNIVMYYHDELTHPDQVHEEFEVPQHMYSFIIGKGGCELRHVQNNYKVRMYIPRDHSVNQNCVLVGDKLSVERAKAYVDKLMWNAEQPRGRDRNDDGDTWGPEEEVEDWMKQYMYKRK